MSTVKRTNSIAGFILGILLIAVLMTEVCPILACADDNPEFNTLYTFPATAFSSDTMNENRGTINTLYNVGTVNDNLGHISSSQGIVLENHGSIESLTAGNVGTNYGTIERIENTGWLGENDESGEVFFICMGNEVKRNDGEIRENAGTVSDNYGKISANYGSVIMRDGEIGTNSQNGTVTFEAKVVDGNTVPAKGTVAKNESSVIIHSGNVTIDENTGRIEIEDATVTVGKNSGNITVGNNATLICNENESGGVIEKSSAGAVVTCPNNDGYIYDATVPKYEIVFTGDDGKARVSVCDLAKDGVYYTLAGSNVIFTLPPEYECSSASKLESGEVNTWVVTADPAEEDTEFTINCRKSSPCDSQNHKFSNYVSNNDATCTEDGTKTAICDNGCGATDTIVDTGSAKGHSYGEWVITKEATETKTGSKERTCSVCRAKDIRVIPNLSHIHSGTLRKGTSETCTVSGVKDYYSCSCGSSFEDANCDIEITDIDAWKAKGGKGYIAPTGHSFKNYTTNNDATCTEDGTKTAICAYGCGATDTVADVGSAKGHTYGKWVITKEATETENGSKERTCSVCSAKDTRVIPNLSHIHTGTLRKGTFETCTVAGVKDYYTCSCGYEFEDENCNIEIDDIDAWKAKGGKGYIAPTGHSFNNYTSNNDATDTEDGTKTAICDNGCGATDTIVDTGSAKGHSYGEGGTPVENTENGTTQSSRSVRGDKNKGAAPVFPHTHDGIPHRFLTYISNNDATCTTDGTKTAICAYGCGATDTIVDTGSAKGHIYGKWVITKEATETENGTKECTCSVCGAKDTDVIPILSHTQNETIQNGTSLTDSVRDTGEKEEISAFVPKEYGLIIGENSEWTKGTPDGLVFSSEAPFDKFESVKIDAVIIKSTYYKAENGSTKITIFSDYLETLNPGEHSIEIVSTDGTASAKFSVLAAQLTDSASQKTGDNSHIILWIALLLVVVGILAGIIVYCKKGKRTE